MREMMARNERKCPKASDFADRTRNSCGLSVCVCLPWRGSSRNRPCCFFLFFFFYLMRRIFFVWSWLIRGLIRSAATLGLVALFGGREEGGGNAFFKGCNPYNPDNTNTIKKPGNSEVLLVVSHDLVRGKDEMRDEPLKNECALWKACFGLWSAQVVKCHPRAVFFYPLITKPACCFCPEATFMSKPSLVRLAQRVVYFRSPSMAMLHSHATDKCSSEKTQQLFATIQRRSY